MYRKRILANNFTIKSRNIQIYSVRQRGSATILWLSREDAIAYMLAMQLNSLCGSAEGLTTY